MLSRCSQKCRSFQPDKNGKKSKENKTDSKVDKKLSKEDKNYAKVDKKSRRKVSVRMQMKLLCAWKLLKNVENFWWQIEKWPWINRENLCRDFIWNVPSQSNWTICLVTTVSNKGRMRVGVNRSRVHNTHHSFSTHKSLRKYWSKFAHFDMFVVAFHNF